jgi:hypothetical protein
MRHFEPAVSHLESGVIGCRVVDVPQGWLAAATPGAASALARRADRSGERWSERWPPGCLCIVLEISIFRTTSRAIDVLAFSGPARRSRPFCRLHQFPKVGATFKTYLGRSAFFATRARACVLHTDRRLGAHGGNLSRRERRGHQGARPADPMRYRVPTDGEQARPAGQHGQSLAIRTGNGSKTKALRFFLD